MWFPLLFRAHSMWFFRAVAEGRTVSLLQQRMEPDGIESFSIPRTSSWGQEVLDLDSLDSLRLFSTGDRDSTMLFLFQRNNFAHRFGLCAAFIRNPFELAPSASSWSPKWWTIRWSDSEGHFGAKVGWSVGRSVSQSVGSQCRVLTGAGWPCPPWPDGGWPVSRSQRCGRPSSWRPQRSGCPPSSGASYPAGRRRSRTQTPGHRQEFEAPPADKLSSRPHPIMPQVRAHGESNPQWSQNVKLGHSCRPTLISMKNDSSRYNSEP